MLRRAALGWIALWPLLVGGCQSGAQQDLVARELRMQEDQIYAMEDYLTQYQQLVCKYRSENAALRRRLANDYYDGEEMRRPQPAPRDGADRVPPPRGTSIEIRETPGGEGEPSPSREIEIDLPEVPPLEGSTSGAEPSREIIPAVHVEDYDIPSGETVSGEAGLAAGEPRPNPNKVVGSARVHGIIDQSNKADSAQISLPEPSSNAPQLRLHGEVVENDSGGGPRIVVNVERLGDQDFHDAADGQVSFMLLDATSKDQRGLARWDFGSADVAIAKQDADDEQTLKFFLELPADTPPVESAELWARLLPREGEKLLAHTIVDLQAPGVFASTEEPSPFPLPEGESFEAVANVDAMGIPARIAASVVEGDWSIARPGEPANLPSAEDVLTGGWRASSEPMPTVVQSKALPPKSTVVRQTIHAEDTFEPVPSRLDKAPTWSAERPGGVAATSGDGASGGSSVAKRPAWSATR